MRIPRRRSAVCPIRNRRDLLRTQRWIIREMSIPRVGKPRRHHLHLNSGRHFPRPGPRLLIRNQRHRRRFSGSMATLTFLLQDGKHIFIKGGCQRGFPTVSLNSPSREKQSHSTGHEKDYKCFFTLGRQIPSHFTHRFQVSRTFSLAHSPRLHHRRITEKNVTVLDSCLPPILSSFAPASRNRSIARQSGSCARPGAICLSTAPFASNIRCWKSARSPNSRLK